MKMKMNLKMNMTKNSLFVAMVSGVFLFVLVYLYYSHGKEGYENESDKFTDSIVQSSEPVMVLFYADWCGHCTKLKPDWDKACEKANKDKKRMFKIDVGGEDKEHKELMKKYDIQGFPTIIIFQNGSHDHYDGPRTVDKMLDNLSLS